MGFEPPVEMSRANPFFPNARKSRLHYFFLGQTSWTGQDLTLVYTDTDGSFSAVWTPSVTGNYLIKAAMANTTEYSAAETIVNLAVMPFTEEGTQNVFSVTSNSTVSDLAFNSNSRQFTFTVSGPADTAGYVDVNIAKTLIDDITKVKVYVDENETEFTSTESVDSWLLHFTYQHSIHSVTLNLGIEKQQMFIETLLGNLCCRNNRRNCRDFTYTHPKEEKEKLAARIVLNQILSANAAKSDNGAKNALQKQ